ncbi:MAG: glycosyl transferase [Candidatus Marinimicrobia bacterium]|nr:glycosyl transferase [Candidatus Neomarinimicrobiota bacterium]
MFERENNPRNVRSAEIVAGLASYQEADSIDYPTQQLSGGLKKHYGDKTSVIINCDNNSPDGTEEVFLGTVTEVPKIYITTPPGILGKGYNFENIFRKMLELDAKVLVCVDADLLSITPEWVKYFIDPILNDYDFVNPLYSRHKYDGTITNNICYPLIYGLFCHNIRQPIGGDFSMSKRFVNHLVCKPWHRTTEEYGIDIFMTMNAILGGFKTCETGLGAKRHKPSAPKLGAMFIQVVSTMFLTIISNYETWKEATVIEQPALFGLRHMELPQELTIDRSAIEKQARDNFNQYKEILERVLSPGIYADLSHMFSSKGIDINTDQWVTIIYDMIAAFKSAGDRNNEIVESLKGLYFGRTLTFMNKTWDWSSEQTELEILAQAKVFHDKRDYLISKLEE